mgnify:CR=1 FL=1
MGLEYRKSVLVRSQTQSPVREIFFDDFEDLLKWSTGGNPVGYSGALDTTTAYNGSKSLKILTDAVTPAVGDYVETFRQIARFPARRIRFTFYSKCGATSWHDFKVNVCVGDTDDSTEFAIRVDTTTNTLKYQDSAGTFQPFVGQVFGDPSSQFQIISFVIDPTAGEFIYAEINDQHFDMAGIAGKTGTPPTEARGLYVAVRTTTRDTDQGVNWIDTVLIETAD